jgi:hypothetical protein
MVSCIKEQLLEGKNVYIDNLASFSVGIVNKKGAETRDDFTISGNIEGVRMRARAVGELSKSQLNLDAVLKRASLDKGSSTTDDGGDDGDDDDIIITPGSGSGSSGNEEEDERKDVPGEDGMI